MFLVFLFLYFLSALFLNCLCFLCVLCLSFFLKRPETPAPNMLSFLGKSQNSGPRGFWNLSTLSSGSGTGCGTWLRRGGRCHCSTSPHRAFLPLPPPSNHAGNGQRTKVEGWVAGEPREPTMPMQSCLQSLGKLQMGVGGAEVSFFLCFCVLCVVFDVCCVLLCLFCVCCICF